MLSIDFLCLKLVFQDLDKCERATSTTRASGAMRCLPGFIFFHRENLVDKDRALSSANRYRKRYLNDNNIYFKWNSRAILKAKLFWSYFCYLTLPHLQNTRDRIFSWYPSSKHSIDNSIFPGKFSQRDLRQRNTVYS